MPTIRDVARHAGVSTATVSRVINQTGTVSPELEALVYRSMKELHYQPNAVARGLKTASTSTIGIIVLDLSNNQLGSLCFAISSGLFHHNYLPLICSSEYTPETEQKYVEHLLSHKVDGIIINSCQPWNNQLAAISQSVPMVAVYRRIQGASYRGDFIDTDGQNGTYVLTKHLLDRGHRRIFAINGPLNTSAGHDRFQGFCKAMQEAGIDMQDYKLHYETNYTVKEGHEAMEYITKVTPAPTAILTTNPEVQLGVMQYCKQHGIRIPEDYSLVCYAPSHYNDLLYVEPTCALQNYKVVGERASQLILERIENPNLPNREIIYSCPIIYGNSVMDV